MRAAPDAPRSFELTVDAAGVLTYTDAGRAEPVRGVLPPPALERWDEAAAALDPDDDEVLDTLPPARLLRVGVEAPDQDWALYLDADTPPRSVSALGQLVATWVPQLAAWRAEGLPPDLPL